ncbi:dTMP kinase [Idiomarina loihiensis]|jgi:dTMP kinase|uniref:Thymidylate kinase n=1 Tax=Idiomarina loihiensis (strain ATCC BAA-735 / DSM 15497 / L2-TR) TaxID=283942 RepID=KTHY_IDILO|nr:MULTISPECIES: dTMP kinase [Idiomarina]Q5QZ32.1 RecName: Full=Thymidylate kinase; AltName: Full=dTMP kinase [Idiomarina loihiensis L2TR]AAV82176.1 Thymidylate kinase [Idiomarina loihiensis L2TR]AGM36206.1 thymidylate kinase [Idiomarina loihiensis GSL 199]MRJ43973.1 dTMP kinase [Idiomarina loihiensis]PHQ88955.1 MAG: thymidylate kinase [Idiomarina sp.]UTW33898.1 dTMP kinase [Idiomarina loihiensis]
MSGKFIVIEGLEGAGKSSAIASVVTHLQAKGIQVETVREPGGTPLAESLRDLVKKKWEEKVSPTTELLLMYASRVQLVDNIIKPALSKNRWVIGDRHDLSSRAYQGGGRELGDELLQKIRKITLGNFTPDLTLLLDVEEKKGLERARERGELDRIEEEDLAFFQRTRQRYLNIAAKDPSIIVIDANQSMLDVHQSILRAIEEYLF